MKLKRRTFLKACEGFTFKEKSNYTVERYFKKDKFNPLEKGFKMYLDFGHHSIPETVSITLIYLDTSLQAHPNEKIEYLIDQDIPAGRRPVSGKHEKVYDVKIEEGSMKLWKVIFKAKPLKDSTLYCSLGSL